MGYLSNVIKDSRVNLAAHQSPLLPSQFVTLDMSSHDGATEARLMHESRSRGASRGRSPSAPIAGPSPDAAVQRETQSVSAEIKGPEQLKNNRMNKRMNVVSRIQKTRHDAHRVEASTDPVDSSDAADKHDSPPVSRRKASSPIEPASTITDRSASAGVYQPESQIPQRPAVRPAEDSPAVKSAKIGPAGSNRQSSIEAVSNTSGLAVSWEAMASESGEITRKKDDAVIDYAAAHRVDSMGTSTEQTDRVIDTGAPVEATVKSGLSKPDQSVSLPAAVTQSKISPSATTTRDDAPRVRIGQVNIIVEEPKAPARSSSSRPGNDDLGSRTFLRSL